MASTKVHNAELVKSTEDTTPLRVLASIEEMFISEPSNEDNATSESESEEENDLYKDWDNRVNKHLLEL